MGNNLYANVLAMQYVDRLNALAGPAHHSQMNDLATNLRAVMDLTGVSENRIQRETGVPQPTINRLLKRVTKDPRDGTIGKVAGMFGLTVEDLRRGATQEILKKVQMKIGEPIRAYDVRAVDGPDDYDRQTEILVEEIDVVVSGGPGAWTPEFVETRFRMPYQVTWFRQVGAKPENVKLMKVHGHSMERTLFHGDRVAVDTGDTRIIDGRVYVFAVPGFDGGAKVKRLYTTSDGRIRVVSDNTDKNQFPDEFLDPEDVEHLFIVGRVIDRSGRGGL